MRTRDRNKTTQASSADHKTAANLNALIRLQYLARRLPLTGSQLVNSLMVGQHRSRVRGRGMDFEELRHYRIGDDIRQMDWKVTNRTRKPHVRVYAEERERPVILVVDQRLSMYFGSQRVMKSVVAAEVAALLAWHVVASGDRVGLLVFNDSQCSELRPSRSQHQIMRILNLLCDYSEKLCGVDAIVEPGELNPILHRVKNLVSHDALIHVVSDLDRSDDETDELLSQLAQRNTVALDYVYDPLEQTLPEQGQLAVSDGRYQVELNASDNALRRRFHEDFKARMDRINGYMRGRKIPVLPLSTARPLEEQLLKSLGDAQGV